MKKLVVPMQVKSVSDAGVVEGYASVFDNVDLGHDVVEQGAFKEIVRTREGKVLHLYAHDAYGHTASGGLPIGLADVEQDEKGLAFRTQLIMEDLFVQRVHVHLKAGTLDGMSIGFDIPPGGADYDEKGVRHIKRAKLWEISAVTFGMNPKARIEAVKRAGGISTIREFEDLIREEGGFSHAQAKLLAVGGWKAMQSTRDEGEAEAGQRLLDYLHNLTKETQ